MTHEARCLLFLLVCSFVINCAFAQQPTTLELLGLFPLTGRLAAGGVQREAAARVAIENINAAGDLLPGITLVMWTYNTNTTQSGGLTALFDAIEAHPNIQGIIGEAASDVSEIVAIGGGVFSLAQIAYSSTAAALSDKSAYPYFTRMVPSDSKQGRAFAEFVASFGWGSFVSAISTSDDYGVGGIREFINAGVPIGVNVTTYQQFLVGATDISVEMRELTRSGSRVFLAFLLASDASKVFLAADENGIVGDSYVWLCSDGCAQALLFTNATNGQIRQDVRKAVKGLVGLAPKGGSGPLFDEFLQQWSTLDPAVYPGSGNKTINLYAPHAYDCVYTWAHVFQTLLANNSLPPYNGPLTFNTIINTNFTGLTGNIIFESNGDRLARYDVLNLQGNNTVFTIVGTWNELFLEIDNSSYGFNYSQPIQWHSGTTKVPDLDLRTPFHYWDCKKEKMGYDPTGKTIQLDTPDYSDPHYIKSFYYCDQYLDCNNMSDEAFDCSPSYTATFVAFGIITGLLILLIPVFVLFTIMFGCIWQKRRIRLLSPVFLLGMCLAAFVGYCSTYAWYGKPQTIACNFQSWLLGLSVNLMISFLFAKTFRIWRIFKSPFKRKKISDKMLFLLVLILMIPCVIILTIWTAFATPTAKMEEWSGEDHYVCATGGLIEYPGGYIFFAILAFYTAVVLLFGVFLAFVTRNVPEEYSESRLVGYSVYNLTFTGIVTIAVFFVLREDQPVAAWIIRTIGILYGFTATLWLQFIPPMVLLVVRDKCRSVAAMKTSQELNYSNSAASMTGTSTGHGI